MSLVPIAAIGWFLDSTVRATIEHRTADVYGGMTEAMFGMASDFIVQPADFDPADPKPFDADRRAVVQALLDRVGASSDNLRLRVVTRTGQVLYANRPGDEAPVVLSPQLRQALAGTTATRFVHGRLIPGTGKAENLIEIYLPVRFAGQERTAGALIASGIDGTVVKNIDGDVRRMQLVLVGGLALLWLALLPISSSLSRRLRRNSLENEYLARHDTLTGLPNRNLLAERLEGLLGASRRRSDDVGVGLLLIDLDGFKDVNDTLGHGKGDELLQQVAVRLRSTVGDEDTVARLGGDEFAVLLHGVTDGDGLVQAADKVCAALRESVCLDGIDVAVHASIGGSVAPHLSADAEQLLQHADIAMYAAKASPEPFVVYRPDIDSHSPSRLALTAELQRALAADDQLLLHFQPVASAASGDVVAFEALVRWNHPVRGLVSPADFVPTAEQSGLIGDLSDRVLDLALAQLRSWQDAGIDVSISVNLSAADLRSMALADEIAAKLERHGVSSAKLELEVTETSVLAHPETAVELVAALRRRGVRIALDDFGTGYSSLTYLKRLAPDRLKIDRSFVAAMTEHATDAEIVRSLIDLAHSLKIGVTAEGVEDRGHWELLDALGCDLIQGYHLARPMPADAATAWLVARSAAAAAGSSSPSSQLVASASGSALEA